MEFFIIHPVVWIQGFEASEKNFVANCQLLGWVFART